MAYDLRYSKPKIPQRGSTDNLRVDISRILKKPGLLTFYGPPFKHAISYGISCIHATFNRSVQSNLCIHDNDHYCLSFNGYTLRAVKQRFTSSFPLAFRVLPAHTKMSRDVYHNEDFFFVKYCYATNSTYKRVDYLYFVRFLG